MTIRISDKRGLPAGFLVNGEFFLMDEGPELVDRWEQIDSLDFQLSILNLTGNRDAILPESEGSRKKLRAHFLAHCEAAGLCPKAKAIAKVYSETLKACVAGGMTDDAAHEYATDRATRSTPKAPAKTAAELRAAGYIMAGSTTDETARREIERDYAASGFDVAWTQLVNGTWNYYTRKQEPAGVDSPGITPKHTPGPWEVHGCAVYTSDKLPNQIANRDPITRHVAQASWDHDEEDIQKPWDYQEAVGNARLIAAAPDLLEACRQSIITLDPMDKDHAELYRLLRAAIDKATGEAV